jgi:hypothetical protein
MAEAHRGWELNGEWRMVNSELEVWGEWDRYRRSDF